MFLCLVTCSLTVTVSLLCQSQVETILSPFTCYQSGNMLPIIKTGKNGLSNFSEHSKVMALKLLELTRFEPPNVSVYFYFVMCWGLL